MKVILKFIDKASFNAAVKQMNTVINSPAIQDEYEESGEYPEIEIKINVEKKGTL